MPDAPPGPALPIPDTPASTPLAGARRLGPRSTAVLALGLLLPAPTVGTLAAIVWWPGPVGQAVYFAAKAWLILLPAVWYLGVERGSPSFSPARRGGLGVGVAVGLVIAALIALGYALIGPAIVTPEALRPIVARNGLDQPARYLALAAYLTVVNALMEEYVWRWFVFRQFEVVLGADRAGASRTRLAWAAAVLAAAGFTVHHVAALGAQFGVAVIVLGSAGVFVGGLAWSGLYLRYRSVWPAYISHAIVDIAVFAVGWRIIFAGD